jgi:hypothetical protein
MGGWSNVSLNVSKASNCSLVSGPSFGPSHVFQQVVEWSCDLRKSGDEESVDIAEAKKVSQLGLRCGRKRRTE